MKESKVYQLLCVIHVLVVGSCVTLLTTIATFGLCMIPSMLSVFTIGKEIIYKEYDYHDSITKRYFSGIAKHLNLVKYAYINIIVVLNIVGIFLGIYTNMVYISYLCLLCIATLVAFMYYIAAYNVFIDEDFTLMDVAIFMFYKPMYLLVIIAVNLSFLMFFSLYLLVILALIGCGVFYAIEIIICSQSLAYKKRFALLKEEDMRFKV